MRLTRRHFIAAAAIGAGAISGMPGAAAVEPNVVGVGDADYAALTLRGYNRRFVAQPRKIFVCSTAEEVQDAVARSVADGLRIAVRSGGHCFEDFVDSAQTESIIDLGRMGEVRWDAEHRAFSVGAGTELGAVYEALFRGWGVTVPAGICLGVGMGGHVSGGGYGPLSRRLGLVADHLWGLEIVTVDAGGQAGVVVATKDGPHADLWWAHTGGGGGNFGVVTRFLLRSREVDGMDPAGALPKPPGSMLNSRLIMPIMSEESFVRFVGNYLAFFEEHSAPGNRFAGLYAPLSFRTAGAGFGEVLILLDADIPDARARLDEFVAAVGAGVAPAPVLMPITHGSYPDTIAQVHYPKGPLPPRVKVKAGYLRKPYSVEQLRVFYRYLTELDFLGESQLEFLPFGGAINATAADATAMPARNAFMKMLIHAAWRLPGDDERYMGWARNMYREVYAETGGVPVPNNVNGGSYINYPDPDLADGRWNTSGVPWHVLYYGDNYARLRRIKAQWDPKDIFRHQLSIGRPDW